MIIVASETASFNVSNNQSHPFLDVPASRLANLLCRLLLLSRHFRKLSVCTASIDTGKNGPDLLIQKCGRIDHSTSVPTDNVLLIVCPLLLKAPKTLRIPGLLGSMPAVNAELMYSFMVVSKLAPFRQMNRVRAGRPSASAPHDLSLTIFANRAVYA